MKISLPHELDEWVQSRAEQIGVEPELIIQQIIDSHRTSNDWESPQQSQDLGLDRLMVESLIDRKLDQWAEQELDERLAAREEALQDRIEGQREEWVAERFDDQLQSRIDAALDERLEQQVESAVSNKVESQFEELLRERLAPQIEKRIDDRVDSKTEATLDERLQSELGDRISRELESWDDELETRLKTLGKDHSEKIQDLRERVIQVKRETDAKAPAAELQKIRERIDALAETLESTRTRTEELANRLEETEADIGEFDNVSDDLADLQSEFAETKDRLNTLGWHVSSLNDRSAVQAELDELKQDAAELDVRKAKCETCNTVVDIGLLAEPACPHCDTRATGVEDATSFFGKPRLLTGSD